MRMTLRTILALTALLVACSDAPGPAGRSEPTRGAQSDVRVDTASAGSPSDASTAATAAPTETERGVVLFLGTSLTAGYGLDADEAYPALIQAKIESAGLPFRVVNAGVSGETSAGALRRIDWLLRQPIAVLVLESGANDGLRGQDPERMKENLRQIIERTRAAYPDARIIIAGMEAPPNLGEDYTSAFRAVFPDLAREYDAVLIPFLLEGVAGVPELNQADGIHPTAEGQAIVARTVWRYLEPVLREVARGRARRPRRIGRGRNGTRETPSGCRRTTSARRSPPRPAGRSARRRGLPPRTRSACPARPTGPPPRPATARRRAAACRGRSTTMTVSPFRSNAASRYSERGRPRSCPDRSKTKICRGAKGSGKLIWPRRGTGSLAAGRMRVSTGTPGDATLGSTDRT